MSVLKQRLFTGSGLASVFAWIVLSGRNELILLLLMLIPTKVFQELRRINLTRLQIQQQTRQIVSDWALFFICLCCVLNVIWFDIQRLYYVFLLYSGWFVLWIFFVLNKNTQNLSLYLLHTCWIHMAIVITLIHPVLINYNISKGGLFWFIFPCSLVMCNDTAAYFCGKYFGKHKLIDLSPKKTLEGFIGAIFVTVLFSFYFAPWLCQFDSLTKNQLPHDIRWCAVHFALFASLFAPFGGFFASALKRASQIKDFGNLLPGHGGFTDRVDCHLFMALFTFLYYNAFIH